MKALRVITSAIAVCLLLALLSCDKIGGALKSVDGKVAGQVLNVSGHGRGYVSVVLIPADGTDHIMETTEESGNFLIDEVPPGEYTMHVFLSGEDSGEIPSDTPTVKVGPGRTMTQNIMLSADKPAS
jgi:hypothetical protein